MIYSEAESLVASMLFDEDCDYEYYIENVKEDYYLSPALKKLHKVIIDLHSRNVKCDVESLFINLGNRSDYIDYMGITHYNTSKFIEAIRVLKLTYNRRRIRQIVNSEFAELDAREDLTDYDIEVTKNNIITQLNTLESTTGEITDNIEDSVLDYLDYLADYKDGKLDDGLMTGFESIDSITYGFKGNQFIILAALEGIGKTSMILSMISNWINMNKKVLFFSLEMNSKQLMQRLISIRGGIPSSMLKERAPLEQAVKERIWEVGQEIQKSNVFINTDMDISVDKIMTHAIKLKKKFGLDAVVIDHLGLLMLNEEAGKDERSKMNYISRNLKRLSKELNVPVIALSQFSRDSMDKHGLKIPTRKMLKESGSLEQDADIVMILHRFLNQADGSPTDTLTQSQAMLVFDKHRDGERKTARLKFDLPTTTFKDYSNAIVEEITI